MPLALQIPAWLLALAWLLKLLEAFRGLPTIPNLLTSAHDLTPAGSPQLTVIVPARNEAPGVAACLRSLLAQDYPNLHILAVDDRSTDPTGLILDALARSHPTRLTALHIAELPAGWLGKTHAMALAARYAIAEAEAPPAYLLFTDADVVFSPEILRRALAHAEATHADHLVTLPTTLAKTAGEAMLLSFMQAMGLCSFRYWRVADPRARESLGVGAFNLLRTSAYLRVGGFDAIPLEILEDMTLGRRVKAAGLLQRIATAPGAVALHWAADISGILNGLTKNIFAAFRFRVAPLLAAAAGLALLCLAPFFFLIHPATRIPALLTLAAVAGLYLLSSRTSRLSPLYAALFPIAAALVLYAMLRSMLITLRDGGVTWRGTFYPLAALRNHANPDPPRFAINPPNPQKPP